MRETYLVRRFQKARPERFVNYETCADYNAA